MKLILRWLSYLIVFVLVLYVLAFGLAKWYEPQILAKINSGLKEHVDGEVQVGSINFTIFEQFPSPSITLNDIYLRGPRYEQYRREFFSAEKIYVNLKLIMILRGEVNLRSLSIRKARINVFRTRDGYSNLEMFKKKETPKDTVAKGPSAISVVLQKIKLEDSWVSYHDSLKGKAYGLRFLQSTIAMNPTDTSTMISLDGKIFFEGMMFNDAKGPYLGNQETNTHLDLEFVPASRQLVIHPSTIGFPKSEIALGGYFKFDSTAAYHLTVHSNNLDFAEGRTIVTPALAAKLKGFEFSKPLSLSLDLLGKTSPGNQPKVDLSFSTENNKITAGGIVAEDIALDGSFMNHREDDKPYDDYNSQVELVRCIGKINGIPTDLTVKMDNLKDPTITLNTDSKVNLKDLNFLTDTTKLKFLSGDFMAHVQYHGRLKEYLDKELTSYEGKLEGKVQITDGSIEYFPKEKKVEQLNVRIAFSEKKMDLEKIAMRVNGNAVELKGRIEGFVPFFFQPAAKGKVRLSIYSPKMDLSTLLRKKSAVTKKGTRKAPSSRVSHLLTVLNDKVEFDMDVRIDEIVSGPLYATSLVSKTQLHNSQLRTTSSKMKFAGGTVALTTSLTEIDRDTSRIQLHTEVLNVDVKKFFAAFDNFSQRSLTSEQLNGKISTWMDLEASVDEHFKLILPTVKGNVKIQLRDGAIQNFEPLEKMGTFLFKKRDFSHVDFAEIKGNFHIAGPNIGVERMEIQSSVLTMFVEGQYSMKDSTDLSIQVPLSNLKKRDKDYKPENVGVDAKVGPSVFIRASNGKDGKLKIGYDPLKKMRKKQ